VLRLPDGFAMANEREPGHSTESSFLHVHEEPVGSSRG